MFICHISRFRKKSKKKKKNAPTKNGNNPSTGTYGIEYMSNPTSTAAIEGAKVVVKVTCK